MVKLEKYINFSIFSNIIIFNSLAGCGNGDNKKKGKGCCSYGQNKDNNDITGDDDDKEKEEEDKKKEDDDDKKKKEEEDKKKEEEENFYKNNYAYFQVRYDDLIFLLNYSIDRNELLKNKEKIDITEDEIYKQKTKDGLDNIEDYLKKLKNKIESDLEKQKQEKIEKESTEETRDIVLCLFDIVDKYKKKLGLSDEKISLGITREQIENEKNKNKLKEIYNNLDVKYKELGDFEIKMIDTRLSDCENDDDFIEKFNYRKNILADRFNDELKNTIKSNILTKEKISDYYSMYQEMINDVFTHGIALDLQIYRYILKLEGFTDALDNIIEKNRIQYDFYTEYKNSNACYNTTIFKKDNNYYLDYHSGIEKNKFVKFKDIYSGIFYIDNEPFKYVRCIKGSCTNGENCISCKLRNLLEKENIGDLYKKIYKEYGGSSDAGDTVRAFIYNNIKPEYQNMELFFRKYDNNYGGPAVVDKGNEDSFKKYDYENGEEEYKNIKKALMLEWALTIEFMKRFILEFTGKKEFYLYRTMGFSDDTNYKPTNMLLSQAVDSTSLFGPCYFTMSNKNIICFHKIKAKLYCCFFNHIINPFSEEESYMKYKEKNFLSCKLYGDHECEIGYIPINQKYTEEVKCHSKENDELEKLFCCIFEKSCENFKQNMLNDPTIKDPKLYVLLGEDIIPIP